MVRAPTPGDPTLCPSSTTRSCPVLPSPAQSCSVVLAVSGRYDARTELVEHPEQVVDAPDVRDQPVALRHEGRPVVRDRPPRGSDRAEAALLVALGAPVQRGPVTL